MQLGAWEIFAIVLLIIVLFGAKKLPDAARSIGRSLRIFKSEMKEMGNDNKEAISPAPQGSVSDPLPVSSATPQPAQPQPAPQAEVTPAQPAAPQTVDSQNTSPQQ